MFDTIVLATDGSEAAAAATESAIEFARRHGAELHVVHVQELGELPPGVEDEDADAFATRGRNAVEEATERAADAGVSATAVVLEAAGPVHEPLVEYAGEADADLLVVGTHGHSGIDRLVLGSVAERTLRASDVPVLVVTADRPLAEIDSVLVPTDGSEASRAAAELAVQLAAAVGAVVHPVNAVDPSVTWDSAGADVVLDSLEAAGRAAVDEVVALADDAGVATADGAVLTGRPHQSILEHADEVDVDLVVMGTHGRGGVGRLLLGSVTERVVRGADRPVLAVGGARAD